ncbi:GDP-mannose 4,6-dehydratase [Euryarchaeota archaeon]|nr:GDP-mannose 4,6-dehydratase [Euryarchaeota archaeon]MDA9828553.1 GDP-mannose 4,6-dehydratase [Candidatus Poseidoniaceae archaeon]MDA8588120.1 GDP-mannose 4,6-dehydratase [Euryarchaeota archaeon]MDA8690594.1 GDP-mannose 4,6-dehydratase [Euryarchaeota archaeon]MDA8700244.1 GDP-mannose 4,6-dehydratase [Euryarchaeota archaeon]
MKKIMITGGAGFIGNHVAQVLLKQGLEVKIYDLKPSSLSKVESVQGDILDEVQLEQAAYGCDAIVHLAAQISVPRSIENPEETYNINVTGTQNVIACAEKMGIRRVLLASSAAVYGDATAIPLKEETIGTLLSPYATSKYDNEHQVVLARERGLEAVAIRFFNVYGPNQSVQGAYAAVIPKVIETITSGQRPVIFGDGQQTRDFVHVQDVAMGIFKLLGIDWNKVHSHVYNVATQQQISILELIETVNLNCVELGILEAPVQPLFENSRIGDIKHSVANIEKIMEQIEWSPTIDFHQGIRTLLQQDGVRE